MNTASTAIKKIIAEYLDSEPSEINDELRLCDLGLDEVDIEELWFSIEDELETTCDKIESNRLYPALFGIFLSDYAR